MIIRAVYKPDLTRDCQLCVHCPRCKGKKTDPGAKLPCEHCLNRLIILPQCIICDGSRMEPYSPKKKIGCGHCSCIECRCRQCRGTGKSTRYATWEVTFDLAEIKHLCTACYHSLDVDCRKCGRKISAAAGRCACGWKEGDTCRRCGNTVGAGLVKIVKRSCKRCGGSKKDPFWNAKHLAECNTCRSQAAAVNIAKVEEFPCGESVWLCVDCKGSGATEPDCVRCGGTGFDMLMNVPHIKGCRVCSAKRIDINLNSWAAFPCGQRKQTCPACAGSGSSEKRSRSTRWNIMSVDILDVPEAYRHELEGYVGMQVCFRCACPDILISKLNTRERFCPICREEGGKETKLSVYNPSEFCFNHTDLKHCPARVKGDRVCGRELYLDETGPYCHEHAKCLMCGATPMPHESFCEAHADYKGFGTMLERGGFARQKGGRHASGFRRINTSKPANSAGEEVKFETILETYNRFHTTYYKALGRLEEIDAEIARWEAKDAAILSDEDLEDRIQVELIKKKLVELCEAREKAQSSYDRYKRLDETFGLLTERLQDVYMGNHLDVEVVQRTGPPPKEPEIINVPKRVKCEVCGKIYEDMAKVRWIVGAPPGSKDISRFYACTRCKPAMKA